MRQRSFLASVSLLPSCTTCAALPSRTMPELLPRGRQAQAGGDTREGYEIRIRATGESHVIGRCREPHWSIRKDASYYGNLPIA